MIKIKYLIILLLFFSLLNYSQELDQSTGTNKNTYVRIPPPSIFNDKSLLNKTSTSNINISYDSNVPVPARTAFAYAASIWEFLLNTDQDIDIDVQWIALGDRKTDGTITLAQCGATSWEPISNVKYPVALAEMISDNDLNNGEADILVKVNSSLDISWYYGTDGNTPEDEVDFVTIILHELAHGLGFSSSFQYNNGIGSWGSNGLPIIFDVSLIHNDGTTEKSLIQDFTNNSTTLGSIICSNQIYFNGYYAKLMNNNSAPKLYAPSAWEAGSSIAHLDETTFPASDPNSLMTPQTNQAESKHSPGEITMGILQDLGWDVNRLITVYSPQENRYYKRGDVIQIKWSDTKTMSVGISLTDQSGALIESIIYSYTSNVGANNTYNYTIPSNLSTGSYRIKVHDVSSFNSGISLSGEIYIGDVTVVAAPTFNPPSGSYTSPIDVELKTTTPNSQIYYTLDNSTPTRSSTLYTNPIPISSTQTIKAKAFITGYESSTSVGDYSYTGNEEFETVMMWQHRVGTSSYPYIGSFEYWIEAGNTWCESTTGATDPQLPQTSTFVVRGTDEYLEELNLKFQYMQEEFATLDPTTSYIIQNEYTVRENNYSSGVFQFVHSYLNNSFNATISANLEGTENYSGAIVQFKDPWYIDDGNSSYYDSQYGKYKNFGVSSSLPWLQKQSPFNPSTASEYKGVFLEQVVETNKPYYSVRVPETQTLTINSQNYTFNFFGWTVSDAELTTPTNISSGYVSTPVIFESADATVKANYKGLHLSSSSTAYTNNNQRKFVRTTNGDLHLVYESMNKVWYEKSTDNGSTWVIMNGGLPLSSEESKHPSIDDYGGVIAIVYQEKDGSNFDIKISFFSSTGTFISDSEVYSESSSYTVDAEPILAWNYDSRLCVVWRDGTYLNYKFGRMNTFINGSTPVWFTMNAISSTNSSSIKPTISTCHTSNTSVYHLAWQQGTTAIKYCSLTADASNNITISAIETPSSGSGYTYNRCPSFDYATASSVDLVWIGENYWGNYYNQIVKRVRTTSWASSFSNFGSESVYVYSPTISSVGFIAWSESGNTDKCFRWGSIKTIDTNGEYLQLCEATSASNVYAMAFNRIGLVDHFEMSSSITSLSKETDSYPVNGRKCVVKTGQSEYYFGINNVSIDGDDISFSSLPEDDVEISRENITDYFMTEPFSLESESEIIFNYRVGITDTLVKEQISEKAEDISFRVYLVDADNSSELQTLEVIKAKELKKGKDNHTTISFKIGKISSKQARLAFMPVTNSKYEYTLADLYTTKDGLQKSEVIDISYKDEISVDQFNLEPNYPNPFNPTTTIRYQIPNASHVVLKVFDMLGKEVATLVNKNQATGRYEVNFDASRLASGTYIYRIEAGSYTKAYKMILLK